MNIALLMIMYAHLKRKQHGFLIPCCLRRQIAGNFENPYDMKHPDNIDLKIFIEEYERHYGQPPSGELLESIAVFSAQENLSWIQSFLSRL